MRYVTTIILTISLFLVVEIVLLNLLNSSKNEKCRCEGATSTLSPTMQVPATHREETHNRVNNIPNATCQVPAVASNPPLNSEDTHGKGTTVVVEEGSDGFQEVASRCEKDLGTGVLSRWSTEVKVDMCEEPSASSSAYSYCVQETGGGPLKACKIMDGVLQIGFWDAHGPGGHGGIPNPSPGFIGLRSCAKAKEGLASFPGEGDINRFHLKHALASVKGVREETGDFTCSAQLPATADAWVLVVREGTHNVYHLMMDYLQAYVSVHGLGLASTIPKLGAVVIDGHSYIPNGQGEKKTLSLLRALFPGGLIFAGDLKKEHPEENWRLCTAPSVPFIMPQEGASSPAWDVWHPHHCPRGAALVRHFSRHILDHLPTAASASEGQVALDDCSGEAAIVLVHRTKGVRRVASWEPIIDAIKSRVSNQWPIAQIELENNDSPRQVKVFHCAKIAIGFHGAGLTHVLWMRPGTQLVEVFDSSGRSAGNVGYRNLSQYNSVIYSTWTAPEGATNGEVTTLDSKSAAGLIDLVVASVRQQMNSHDTARSCSNDMSQCLMKM